MVCTGPLFTQIGVLYDRSYQSVSRGRVYRRPVLRSLHGGRQARCVHVLLYGKELSHG